MARVEQRVPRVAIALMVASLGFGSSAMAQPAAMELKSEEVEKLESPHRHAVYFDVLGKGGLYGVGYDVQLDSRFSVGGLVSFYVLDGERTTTISPYLGLRITGGARHRWFAHTGPSLVKRTVPSPVDGWNGLSTTSVGAELSSGYEYRGPLLIRAYAMAAVGQGGVAPWLGASIGKTF